MSSRSLFVAIFSLLCAGCATTPHGERGGSESGVQQRWFTRDQVPDGFVLGDGRALLGLVVDIDLQKRVVARMPQAAEDANISLIRTEMGQGTTVRVSNGTQATLKYDLYISPDGIRYQYTSSCPLMTGVSSYENWPMQIHSFAMGNVRETDSEMFVCM